MNTYEESHCSAPEGCSVPAASIRSKDYCYSAQTRSSVLQGLPFGGVPTVLVLNFICFLALLFLFSHLRKLAWDYGRLALVNDTESITLAVRSETQEHLHSPSFVSASVQSAENINQRDGGLCSWLTVIFRIKEEEIRDKCGEDAVHYLSFQRHIISLLVMVGTVSVGVVLPVNFSGTLLENHAFSFGRTTIANLDTEDRLMWLHTTVAFLYLLLTVHTMRKHNSRMHYKKDDLVKCTLFVSGMSKSADESEIKQHFEFPLFGRNMIFHSNARSHQEQAYENCVVLESRVCYNVARLMYLNSERMKTEQSKKYFLQLQAKEHRTPMINPKPCGWYCCCSVKCCKLEEAVDYYTKQEAKLREEYRNERERVKKKPLGMAFVTLQNESTTSIILKDFNACKCQGCYCRRVPASSTFSSKLRTRNWTVSYAPDPQNLYWEHLSVRGFTWWIRCFSINTVLVGLLFFLTTPAIIISTVDKFNVTKPVENLNNPVITQFFPTLLLWFFSSLLPTIVYYSAFLEAHWTRSGENRTTMHKCYTFLVLMVLVLPSLGLTSLDVFFRWLFDKSFLEDAKVRFECVVLPDNGAFFVNYVITAAFIGNAMDLLRIPGLLLYMIRLCLARSAAERKNVKQHQATEFHFGAAYAWLMCIFTVVMTYSIVCPIITPFGLMYILLKHLADRYNMYYAYLPTKLDKNIHSGAVNQVMAAPILCLVWLLFFSVVRAGFSAATSLFTLVTLIVTVIFSFSYGCFGHFKYLSSYIYKTDAQEVDELENGQSICTLASSEEAQMYTAQVLQNSYSEEVTGEDSHRSLLDLQHSQMNHEDG